MAPGSRGAWAGLFLALAGFWPWSASALPEPVLRVPLKTMGYSYVTSAMVDGRNLSHVIVDTGSADLVALACDNNTAVSE